MSTTAKSQPSSSGHPRNSHHRPQKTAMLLAQRIVGEITSKKLEPGSPLLSEKDMLEDYGVARGTLREALRFLEIQGVISIKTGPGGGPIVAAPSPRPLASTIAMLLQLHQAPFRNVLEARVVLEPALAARAARRINEEQQERLRASVQRMRDHIDDLDFFLQENTCFHEIIAEAADNELFALTIASLYWITDATSLGVEYPQKVRESVCREHQRISQAIRAGDADRAATAMGVHIGDFAAYVERYYPKIMDEPLRWDQVQW